MILINIIWVIFINKNKIYFNEHIIDINKLFLERTIYFRVK